MNYERFINETSSKRVMSPLRRLFAIEENEAMISLSRGMPNPDSYPFETVEIKTKEGKTFTIEGKELQTALNYANSAGIKPLLEWLKNMQMHLHSPPYAGTHPDLYDLIVTIGADDGQCKALEMLVGADEPVLVSEPAYPGTLAMLKPLSSKLIPVKSDAHGTDPVSMKEILEQLDSSCRSRPRSTTPMPKVIILQPNHCNPTGTTTSLSRRMEIYALAQKYDLLIIEDDPYYFLSFGGKQPLPSYLSLDIDGRVLRVDSFSKIISAGLRVGFLCGPKPLVQRVLIHISCGALQCSTFSQTMVYTLLQDWGLQRYFSHAGNVATFYEKRCVAMMKAAKEHLTEDLAEWQMPTGGMFLWIKCLGVKDTHKMIMEKAIKMNVVLTPGNYFMCDSSEKTSYLRASFSAASDQEMREGFSRLAMLIRQEQEEHRNDL